MDEPRLATRKEGTQYVLDRLMQLGVNPYLPTMDVEGVDAIVRQQSGTHLEVQVRTSTQAHYPRWFRMQRLEPRPNLYIVCLALGPEGQPMESWIVPSEVFARWAVVSPEGSHDLDLDSTPPDESRNRGGILAQYQNRWELLTADAAKPWPTNPQS